MSKKWNKSEGLALPEASVKNALTYVDYLKRLQELALNMFEWKNLPYDIDERFLELSLFEFGVAVFFREDVMNRYLALNVMINGELDVYRVPKRRRAYAVNGYQRKLTDEDSVLIWNNYLREPSYPTILMYAQKLYNIERAIDVNVSGQKFPVVVVCDESERLTMKNLMKNYEGNEPFIFGTKSLELKNIQALQTGVPYLASDLMNLKARYWNEALAYLGIESANTEKAERLVTDEVRSNLGYAHAQRFTRLNMRRKACEQINDMFGLDIWVDFRSDVDTIAVDNTMTEGSNIEVETEVTE